VPRARADGCLKFHRDAKNSSLTLDMQHVCCRRIGQFAACSQVLHVETLRRAGDSLSNYVAQRRPKTRMEGKMFRDAVRNARQRPLLARLALALVAATLMAAQVVPAAAQQPYQLRIGGQTPPVFEYMYWHHSIRNGFFKKYGIEARFVGFTAGLTGTQALAGGSIDVGCDGVSSIISAIGQGASLRTVQMINGDNTYAILARDTFAKPADLRGKRWAITQMGAISQTYSALWLDANGVKAEKGDVVDWVPVGGTAARVRAVIAGQVDAGIITMGDWVRIRNEKGIKLLGKLADSVPPLPLSLCAVTTKLIAERPDVVQGYINGSLDAVRHARTPEGKAEIIKLTRELNPAKLTDEELDEIYEYHFGAKSSPFVIDPNGGMYPEVLAGNIAMMVADKSLKAPLPIDKVWEPRFVNAYLAENGWYDARTNKAPVFLRDLLSQR